MIDIDKRKVLVFDLEVAPYDFDSHYDEDTKAYLLKYAKDDESIKNTIESLVFSPFTSELVAIGMWDMNEEKGCVLLNAGQDLQVVSEKENIKYVCDTERGIVERFWNIIRKNNYNLFVTFNGREFDCPYIMLRSLILKSRPSCNLMKGGDFMFREYHIDLLKELTFFKHSPTGARRKFSLDFYCKQLGVESPKCGGVAGDMIGHLFRQKEFKMIADYSAGDVIAEAELFKVWNQYLDV